MSKVSWVMPLARGIAGAAVAALTDNSTAMAPAAVAISVLAGMRLPRPPNAAGLLPEDYQNSFSRRISWAFQVYGDRGLELLATGWVLRSLNVDDPHVAMSVGARSTPKQVGATDRFGPSPEALFVMVAHGAAGWRFGNCQADPSTETLEARLHRNLGQVLGLCRREPELNPITLQFELRTLHGNAGFAHAEEAADTPTTKRRQCDVGRFRSYRVRLPPAYVLFISPGDQIVRREEP